MNFPLFIARKVVSRGEKRFSNLIIRISIAAIALSMVVMIMATAMIAGFKKEIRSKVFGFWGHIHIMHASINHTLEPVPIDKNQSFYPHLDTIGSLVYQDYAQLFGVSLEQYIVEKETFGGVRHIQSFAIKPGIIKTKDQMEGIIVKGVDDRFEWSFMERFLVDGQMPVYTDSAMSEQVLISQQTADRLELKVGSKFIVHFVSKGEQLRRRFEVRGIYRTGLDEYDKKFILADMRKVQQVLNWSPDQVGGFEIFLEDIRDLDVYKRYLLRNELDFSLYAETIREKDPSIFDWLELQNINEAVILILMFVVAIINTITALLILILERTNMIGILKALGSSNWKIQRIFLYYASIIVIMGLFWGNLIGLFLAFLQDQFKFIRLSEADYYLSYAPIHWNIWTIIGLNIGTLVITFLFLIIPSFLVTTISPIKAIRFK